MRGLVCIAVFTVNISLGQIAETAFVGFDTGALIKIEVEDCDAAYIGNSGAMFDIAITPSGKLFGTNSQDLFRINTTDATTTYVGDLSHLGGINSLMALNDDHLLTLALSNAHLYKISTANAATTDLGYLGEYASAGDITFLRGEYYMATAWPENGLVKFALNENFTAITSAELVGIMNTPYESVYGVLTIGSINCTEDNLKLVAFEGFTVYEVNTENAYCTVLCDSIYPAGAWGAASTSEVAFQAYESMMAVPNVFTPNGDNVNDVFSPVQMEGVRLTELFVYNRWGNLVHQSAGPSFGWDGNTPDNIACHEGVYYYILRYSDFCDRSFEKKGAVTLLK